MEEPTKIQLPPKSLEKCHFCNSHIDDPILLGEKYRIGDIIVHYYCVLLSTKAVQKGADDDGLWGFLYNDIKRELYRAKDLVCTYCKERGAASGCCKCKDKFHVPCSIIKGGAAVFQGDYSCFCAKHRNKQIVPREHLMAAEKPPICVVCQFQVVVLQPGLPLSAQNLEKVLWAPCCRMTWYHRNCIQQLALSQGSLFKCAICSNKDKFRNWMIKFGIFIPERDASWELETNAYRHLEERNYECSVKRCRCNQGRGFDNEGTMWEVVLCTICANNGTHVYCSRLKLCQTEWVCRVCATVVKKENASSQPRTAPANANGPLAAGPSTARGNRARRGHPCRTRGGTRPSAASVTEVPTADKRPRSNSSMEVEVDVDVDVENSPSPAREPKRRCLENSDSEESLNSDDESIPLAVRFPKDTTADTSDESVDVTYVTPPRQLVPEPSGHLSPEVTENDPWLEIRQRTSTQNEESSALSSSHNKRETNSFSSAENISQISNKWGKVFKSPNHLKRMRHEDVSSDGDVDEDKSHKNSKRRKVYESLNPINRILNDDESSDGDVDEDKSHKNSKRRTVYESPNTINRKLNEDVSSDDDVDEDKPRQNNKRRTVYKSPNPPNSILNEDESRDVDVERVDTEEKIAEDSPKWVVMDNRVYEIVPGENSNMSLVHRGRCIFVSPTSPSLLQSTIASLVPFAEAQVPSDSLALNRTVPSTALVSTPSTSFPPNTANILKELLSSSPGVPSASLSPSSTVAVNKAAVSSKTSASISAPKKGGIGVTVCLSSSDDARESTNSVQKTPKKKRKKRKKKAAEQEITFLEEKTPDKPPTETLPALPPPTPSHQQPVPNPPIFGSNIVLVEID